MRKNSDPVPRRRADLLVNFTGTSSKTRENVPTIPTGKPQNQNFQTHFAAQQLKFLEYLVPAEGILPNPKNSASITILKDRPHSREYRIFLGAASF